ncbi:hypothetical protein [uncultured Endozoicomonas sp.]|uniref:hypothetical protein n=1 Tax=uncultured Endozoicomonas sp. TaxID=432652 RepID=UPI00263201D7|nr:hypothetical protein [uncultured Endozoicomonas sp.]
MPASKSIPSLVSTILTQGISLKLQPADLAYLTALRYWRATESRPEFSEEELHVVFQSVEKARLDDNCNDASKRCNDVIRRLLQQHLLICLEGGEQRNHAYLITPLSEQIVDSICVGMEASKEALSTLFMTVASHLQEIRDSAEQGGNEPFWKLQIEAPLDITVNQLVTSIDHRQRQLDQEAIQTRREVVELLKQDWQNSISQCEQLLTSTQSHLQDLQRLLLASCHQLRSLLETIARYCEKAQRMNAINSIIRLEQHLDRIEHWSGERMNHWEGFHHRVHQYLRQFVTMDERKALMERVREGIRNYREQRWYLRYTHEEPLMRLRDIEPPQPKENLAQVIHEEGDPSSIEDFDALKQQVKAWLVKQQEQTGELPAYEQALEVLASQWPMEKLHMVAGWLFSALTEMGHQQHQQHIADHQWQEIVPDFSVERLRLNPNSPQPTREKHLVDG